jgi:hypothetical protein
MRKRFFDVYRGSDGGISNKWMLAVSITTWPWPVITVRIKKIRGWFIPTGYDTDISVINTNHSLSKNAMFSTGNKIQVLLFLKNGAFWDVTPRGHRKNRRFGETHRLRHESDKNRRARNNVSSIATEERYIGISSKRDSVASHCYVVPSSPILVTLNMEATRSFETSVLTRATGRIISEDGILHSHSRENFPVWRRKL